MYWIDGGRSYVKRVPVAGGPDEVLVDLQSVLYPLGIAADAQDVYAMGSPGRLSQSLYRVPYEGGSFIRL